MGPLVDKVTAAAVGSLPLLSTHQAEERQGLHCFGSDAQPLTGPSSSGKYILRCHYCDLPPVDLTLQVCAGKPVELQLLPRGLQLPSSVVQEQVLVEDLAVELVDAHGNRAIEHSGAHMLHITLSSAMDANEPVPLLMADCLELPFEDGVA